MLNYKDAQIHLNIPIFLYSWKLNCRDKDKETKDKKNITLKKYKQLSILYYGCNIPHSKQVNIFIISEIVIS